MENTPRQDRQALKIKVDFHFRECSQPEHQHDLEIVVVPADSQDHGPAMELAAEFIRMFRQPVLLQIILGIDIELSFRVDGEMNGCGDGVGGLEVFLHIATFTSEVDQAAAHGIGGAREMVIAVDVF